MAERRGQIGQRMAGAVARVRGESTIAPGRAAGTPRGPRGRRSVPGVRSIGTAGIAGVTAALVLALAGCTGAPDPVASSPGVAGTVIPTSPTTPSPTPSPSPTTIAAPERPAAMDRDDAEGAIAAATYFISLYSYVYASGDLAEWSAMSDPGCGYCSGVSDSVAKLRAAGSRIEGGGIAVVTTSAFPMIADTGIYPIDLELSEEPSREVDDDGTVVNELSGGRTLAQLDVAWASAGWRVRAVKTTDEPTP